MEMKVSVIIPVYNGEKYISKCLERLGKEQYPDIEITVVNDGSKDNTAKILAAADDARVTVITQENAGVSAARNAALDVASGDAVLFLDCDDAMEENCIGRLVDLMNEHNADIVRFRLCYSYPDGTVRDGCAEYSQTAVIEKEDFYTEVYRRMMEGIRYNHIVRTLYRREVIDGLRFRTDLHTAEDLCFNIKAFSVAKKYVYTPDIHYYYYCSGTGLTGSGLKFAKKMQCNFKVAKAIKEAMSEWGCDTLGNRLRADTRILRITCAKVRRMLFGGDAF